MLRLPVRVRRQPFIKEKNMEMRDVFRRDGTFTGMAIEKHTPMQKGWYLSHAIIIMKTDGGYIMQQRAPWLKHSPGMWDVTGGGVSAGEKSSEAAVREAFEELGVTVDPAALRLMLTEITEWGEDYGMICDVYAARVEVPAEGFKIAEREVSGVKIVPFGEFIDTVTYNKSEAFRSMLKRVEAEI